MRKTHCNLAAAIALVFAVQAAFAEDDGDIYEFKPVTSVVTYDTALGAAQTITARGYLARAIQHEVDHLDGVLYVDRMSAIERLRYAAKLKQLAKANGGAR